MKKIYLVLFAIVSITSNAQKNEIFSSIGFWPYGGETYQLKYERIFSKKLAIQTGFRYHNEIEYETTYFSYDSLGNCTPSQSVRSTFTSKKIDFTMIFLPINKSNFKLKTGIGCDIGLSLYSWAFEGITHSYLYKYGLVEKQYWNYEIENLVDFGMHYMIAANYYLKNNMFFSGQVLYNQVFKVEYSLAIHRKSTCNFSLGIGYQF